MLAGDAIVVERVGKEGKGVASWTCTSSRGCTEGK